MKLKNTCTAYAVAADCLRNFAKDNRLVAVLLSDIHCHNKDAADVLSVSLAQIHNDLLTATSSNGFDKNSHDAGK